MSEVKHTPGDFKAGDFVFYFKNGGTHSAKVWATTKKRVIISNPFNDRVDFENPKPDCLYVTADKLQLQSEWEKEHN